MRHFTTCLLAATLCIATGCDRAALNESEVTVKLLDFDGFEKLVASKKGKVVVVDCWSTT
ncbi:MAG: hypothetical protein WD176_05290 [Pirellulales bacterium]